MTRRMVLLSSLASLACNKPLRADSAQQVWDLFGGMAASLSAANPQEFLTAFDKTMPGYQKLSDNVTALVHEFEIQSSVEFDKNEGDDQKRVVEAEWLMILRPLQNSNLTQPHSEVLASDRREQVLKCTVAKQGRKWKMVALEPVEFFAPPAG
jgi:hypothetical protein